MNIQEKLFELNAFEIFCSDTHTSTSFFNKKHHLVGLKDGFEIRIFKQKMSSFLEREHYSFI